MDPIPADSSFQRTTEMLADCYCCSENNALSKRMGNLRSSSPAKVQAGSVEGWGITSPKMQTFTCCDSNPPQNPVQDRGSSGCV